MRKVLKTSMSSLLVSSLEKRLIQARLIQARLIQARLIQARSGKFARRFSERLANKGERRPLKNYRDERGSISVLTLALFLLTVVLIMISTNVATVTLAKRSLTQSAESAAQRGAHFLDEEAYYTGKFNVITMAQNLFGRGPQDPGVPIDCDMAQIGITQALDDLAGESEVLIAKGVENLTVSEIACDGRDIRVSLQAEIELPFQLTFLNIRSVKLISSATTFNQRNNGFYLFGYRIG